jgi:NAD-dependent dihydropyrimidine dehydrogenase PreA subunit
MKYLANVVTLGYDQDKCTGCGRCTEVCPRGVFAMRDKRAVVTDRDLCIECGACEGNCEFDAITVKSGVGCAAAMINGILRKGDADGGCCGPDTGCC